MFVLQRDERLYLARGHEEGEDEDEDALGHWQPVGLLQGEEDGSVQTGFSRAAETESSPSAKCSFYFCFYVSLAEKPDQARK